MSNIIQPPSAQAAGVNVRWMIRRDLPEVLDIEQLCFEFPWTEEQCVKCLRQRSVIGMVADHRSDAIAGYMIYELQKTRLHILNFAVAPRFQRQGIGRAMADKLKSKVSYERRNRLLLEVRETNLDAQLFFRAMGFRAVSVLRDYYDDSSEDAYVMQYLP